MIITGGISHYEAGRMAAEFMNGIHSIERGKALTEIERLQMTLFYVHLMQMNQKQEAVELSKLFDFGEPGKGQG